MDPDMNKYDLEHVTAAHPKMTREEWEKAYHAAWAAYYTPEHRMTILRRAAASGMGMSRLLAVLFAFSAAFPVEKLHPLQAGAFRLKYRLDRRPSFPCRSTPGSPSIGSSSIACADAPCASRRSSPIPIWL